MDESESFQSNSGIDPEPKISEKTDDPPLRIEETDSTDDWSAAYLSKFLDEGLNSNEEKKKEGTGGPASSESSPAQVRETARSPKPRRGPRKSDQRLGFSTSNNLYPRASLVDEQFVRSVLDEGRYKAAKVDKVLKNHDLLVNKETRLLLQSIWKDINNIPNVMNIRNPKEPRKRQASRNITFLREFYEDPRIMKLHEDIARLIVYWTDPNREKWVHPEVAGIENYMHPWGCKEPLNWMRDKELHPDNDLDAFYELVTQGLVEHIAKPPRKRSKRGSS